MKKIIVSGLMILMLFIVACGGAAPAADDNADSMEEVAEDSVMEDSKEATDAAMEETAAPAIITKVHEVNNKGLEFTPAELTIKAGEKVLFNVLSTHNVVEVSAQDWEANSKTPLADGFKVDFGKQKEITFDTPGTYYYVCQPHVKMGMKGKIVVE